MYAKLKQMMTEKGYTVSEGDGWSASDTAEFNVFAHFILGVPHNEAYKMISYPTLYEKEWAIVNGGADIDPPQPMAAPIDPPVQEQAPIDPPVQEQPEGAPLVFNVTEPESDPVPPVEPEGSEGEQSEDEKSEEQSEESQEGADESEEA